MKKSYVILQSLVIAALITSCGESTTVDQELTSTEVTQASLDPGIFQRASKVQDIFYSVPSPMDMASILKKVGAEYDMGLLNDVKKVGSYTSARSRALNLGIYGADLSYASIFSQNQESIIYLSCSKRLADNLGVTKAFDESTIERMEANVENRDSLLNIISETYYMLDAYLKENDRDHISAMIIAAGWIEGLYLATSIADRSSEADPVLVKRIAEQKLSIDNLLELVTAYNSSNVLDDILDDLNELNMVFANVSIEKEKPSISKTADGKTVIGGKTETNMSPETLSEITKLVADIRGRYIS